MPIQIDPARFPDRIPADPAGGEGIIDPVMGQIQAALGAMEQPGVAALAIAEQIAGDGVSERLTVGRSMRLRGSQVVVVALRGQCRALLVTTVLAWPGQLFQIRLSSGYLTLSIRSEVRVPDKCVQCLRRALR